LHDAMAESREKRDVHLLARAATSALVATLVFALSVFVLVRVVRWGAQRIGQRGQMLAEYVKVGEHRALNPAAVGRVLRRLVLLTGWGVGLMLTNVWLVFVLERFPHTRAWGEQLEGYLVGLLGDMTNAGARAIPGLVVVAVILLVTRMFTQAAARFLERVERGRLRIGWLDAETAVPTRRIASAVLWLFALAMAYPYLPGANTDAFKGLSVLVGIMISIGASGIVGQAVSGLMLIYSRAVRVHEYVRVNDIEGTVTELGLFSVRLRTGLGEEIVLPNALVISSALKNYSRVLQTQGFVVDVTVSIGYATPWRQVHAMLLEAAKRTPGILMEPQPYVVQASLGDFYIVYRLVACTGSDAPRQRALMLSALHASILDVFNENGVQIMSPHYLSDPPAPQVVPPARWYEPPAGKADSQEG
jgi:small-conductance mechanosensitive channel